ncbi:DUF3995 domain-containing protein [Mesonia mobilis]|uniref:DUF3995 domain-containing protein n=1 Tax=Mesonia mobilis TaxID=369791 RepID=UPI0024B8B1D5|nr:DUF3995 domain-containing protein [Mesonia mobilis]
MKSILARILTVIFFTLSIIHFYWALGGQWGFESALPSNEQGIKILQPSTVDCIAIGSLLLLFGFLYYFSKTSLKNKLLDSTRKLLLWIIPIIFLIRSIGDFRFFGFFKQVKGTEFANLDSVFYSPLCLIIAVIGISYLVIKTTKKNNSGFDH